MKNLTLFLTKRSFITLIGLNFVLSIATTLLRINHVAGTNALYILAMFLQVLTLGLAMYDVSSRNLRRKNLWYWVLLFLPQFGILIYLMRRDVETQQGKQAI